jgi:anti-anti-sigma factor
LANNNRLHLVAIEPDGLVHAAADAGLTGPDAHVDSTNAFESLLGANWPASRVMLDFSPCTMIDSATIGWLVTSNRQFKNAGGKLVLYSLSPRVRQVLELLKLERLLHLAANEPAARAMFRSGAFDEPRAGAFDKLRAGAIDKPGAGAAAVGAVALTEAAR